MTHAADADARSAVLGRIRDILGSRRAARDADYQAVARDYEQHPSLDQAGRVELFVERLQHYQVGVYRCEAATLPRTIDAVVEDRKKSRLVVPRGLPRDWLPARLQALDDGALGNAELDACEGVVTGCSVAIASTGTIVLRHGPEEGRRALTLVPDYHLCIVGHEQIVETVPEALRRLAESSPALVTTISGPSATADIEMTRIRGVHGPRTLDVIVVA